MYRFSLGHARNLCPDRSQRVAQPAPDGNTVSGLSSRARAFSGLHLTAPVLTGGLPRHSGREAAFDNNQRHLGIVTPLAERLALASQHEVAHAAIHRKCVRCSLLPGGKRTRRQRVGFSRRRTRCAAWPRERHHRRIAGPAREKSERPNGRHIHPGRIALDAHRERRI